MSDLLLSERQDAVLTLTLNRPDSLNALTTQLLRALTAAFAAAGRDGGVRAILVTGAGRAFCAGQDLKEVAARGWDAQADLGEDLRLSYMPLIRAIRGCPQPVIAAINGVAAGAGLSLALACDLRLAAAGAELVVAFVRVGLVPDAGSLFFLSRMLGLSKATQLALTGEALAVEEAQRLGLVAAVVPSDQLPAVAAEQARQLAVGPAKTYALIKRGLERALDRDLEQVMELEAQLQALVAKSSDTREAIEAFLEKRKPVFRGR
jgi:2-(1,2-epoxy-1,2-dihydrophenyl)acetyl-CoA isomerase